MRTVTTKIPTDAAAGSMRCERLCDVLTGLLLVVVLIAATGFAVVVAVFIFLAFLWAVKTISRFRKEKNPQLGEMYDSFFPFRLISHTRQRIPLSIYGGYIFPLKGASIFSLSNLL